MSMVIAGVGNGVPIHELSNDRAQTAYGRTNQSVPTVETEEAPVDIDQTTKELEQISLAFNKRNNFV